MNQQHSLPHPLARRWTLWFDNPSGYQKLDSFGETLRPVYTFGTVEDFWCIYHNIAPPGELKPNCDMHLFKEGVEPKWEDPTCANGGRWTVNIPKGPELEKATNKCWLDAILACIGETYYYMDDICGVACNIREKGNRICLWTKTSVNRELQQTLGEEFKTFLDVEPLRRISYLAHNDARNFFQKSRVPTDMYSA